jgi:hypothetical protein
VKPVRRTLAPRRVAEIPRKKEDNEFLALKSFATKVLTFGNLQNAEE